jgi:hypothetical protein
MDADLSRELALVDGSAGLASHAWLLMKSLVLERGLEQISHRMAQINLIKSLQSNGSI